MAIPISNVTRRQVYAPSGSGGAGPYAFTFEILANTDIAVYKDDTLLTLTTHYTVTINANGTGSVTITAAGLALSPTSPTQYAIVGNRTIARSTDFTTGGDFFANTINDELDQQTIFAQQNAEGLQRALTAPQTDPTTIDMTLPRAADRANKTLAFDANGDPTLGISAADVANAVTYATNAANSATAAASSASSASSSASSASSSASTASTQASNASTSATSASNSASSASTSATNAASSASTATTQASNASTSATNAASSASAASTSASNAASSASAASTSASNAASAQTAAEAARDQTLASFDSFDDRYLGAKSSAPSVDNDGNALVAGALYFNSTTGVMNVYTGSVWVAAYVSGTDFLAKANNLSDLNNTATARTNLGGTTVGIGVFTAATVAAAQQAMDVEVGVDVQAYSANLQGASQGGINGFKNRIINGAMVIDQRNAGAAVTNVGGTPGVYSLDRFRNGFTATTARYSIQKVADAPEGFYNSLKVTITTDEASLAAGSASAIGQIIEGFNCYDIKTTGAQKPTAFSFWVKSSKTGTFVVEFADLPNSRGVSATYTINSANTWEYKTIAFPADTGATWTASNASAGILQFMLFAGSTFTSGTLQTTWASYTNANRFVGQSNLADTNGATFYITGVQLEVGSTATSFDYRPYGTELALCQRYYEETNNNRSVEFQIQAITNGLTTTRFLVRKRTTPTVTVYSSNTGVAGTVNNGNGNVQTSISGISQWPDCFAVQMAGTTSQIYTYFWQATAEL